MLMMWSSVSSLGFWCCGEQDLYEEARLGCVSVVMKLFSNASSLLSMQSWEPGLVPYKIKIKRIFIPHRCIQCAQSFLIKKAAAPKDQTAWLNTHLWQWGSRCISNTPVKTISYFVAVHRTHETPQDPSQLRQVVKHLPFPTISFRSNEFLNTVLEMSSDSPKAPRGLKATCINVWMLIPSSLMWIQCSVVFLEQRSLQGCRTRLSAASLQTTFHYNVLTGL